MPLFVNRDYVSDITQFLQQLKSEKQYLEQQQQEGRAILWDKPLSKKDREIQAEFDRAKVPSKAYPYQTTPKH